MGMNGYEGKIAKREGCCYFVESSSTLNYPDSVISPRHSHLSHSQKDKFLSVVFRSVNTQGPDTASLGRGEGSAPGESHAANHRSNHIRRSSVLYNGSGNHRVARDGGHRRNLRHRASISHRAYPE